MTELLLWSFYPFTRYNGISDDLPSPAYGIKSLAVYIQINSAGIADCYNNLLIAVPHHTVTRLQKRFFCLFVINPCTYPCQLTRIDFQHNRFNLLLYNLIILCNPLRLNLDTFRRNILQLLRIPYRPALPPAGKQYYQQCSQYDSSGCRQYNPRLPWIANCAPFSHVVLVLGINCLRLCHKGLPDLPADLLIADACTS